MQCPSKPSIKRWTISGMSNGWWVVQIKSNQRSKTIAIKGEQALHTACFIIQSSRGVLMTVKLLECLTVSPWCVKYTETHAILQLIREPGAPAPGSQSWPPLWSWLLWASQRSRTWAGQSQDGVLKLWEISWSWSIWSIIHPLPVELLINPPCLFERKKKS